ncbi:MAG TPA: transglutaminase domain-containing protein, partial [Solirubrobacteraceae bacterium]|nr:transglutaminase domain-containing protein [Solirubrobacteraceae bacterium]
MAATAVRAAPSGRGAREAPATGPLAAPGIARLVGFIPLGLFGALHWGALLTPKADGRLMVAVGGAVAAGALLLVTGPDPRHRVRAGGAIVATLGLGLLGLLLAGVPLRLLVPDAWDDLAAGLAQGMQSLPGITVPYRGADEWVRSALVLSGVAIAGLAALLAFWPRPRARTPGFPLAAAVALGALYAISIVERGPQSPYLGGAVFCLLLATFLWLERLRADQVGVAALCVAAVTVAGALVAPRLDADTPWVDYESIAERLQPEKAATFTWNHSYGPMTWPRDGREVLRIRAPTQSYWKTVNLDEFDGLRWVDSNSNRRVVDTEMLRGRRDWFQTIRVVDRGLRSRQFVVAGHAIAILRGGPGAVALAPGTFETTGRPLAPGSSYRAQVYVPRPSDRQLRRAGTDYPDFAVDYLGIRLPERQSRTSAAAVRFKPFGTGGEPDVLFGNGFQPGNGDRAIGASPYARVYDLARSLRARADTPFEYVQAVLSRVRDGASYSESPPPSRVPLVDFLFGSRLGYCQQFSGATALLLRMGGVPARVTTGFSPGRFDRRRGEYIVRDDDAHSWVEVYFPRLGWVTMDPTPAASPARSQLTDRAGPSPSGQRPEFGLGQAGDRPSAPGDFGTALAERDGTDWVPLLLGGGLLVAALLAGAAMLARRGRLPGGPLAPELAELQRALHRTGRTPPAATTLTALERSLGGSDAALGYLRALR